jgi:hypothetical protein
MKTYVKPFARQPLQCMTYESKGILKGGYKPKSYASKYDNIKPSLCRVYAVGSNGELLHKDWVKP